MRCKQCNEPIELINDYARGPDAKMWTHSNDGPFTYDHIAVAPTPPVPPQYCETCNLEVIFNKDLDKWQHAPNILMIDIPSHPVILPGPPPAPPGVPSPIPTPSQLPSRKQHVHKRCMSLLDEIQSYIDAGRLIEPEWLKELEDLARDHSKL